MERLEPHPLGGTFHTFAWRGHRVGYVKRGAGPPLVLVHSLHAAASALEWRMVLPELAKSHTCYAVDLLGFGDSDRPLLDYSAALYVELLRDFLVEVVQQKASLMGSSLGATYAVALAAQHPNLVSGVVANGPAGISRLVTPGGFLGGLLQGLFRSALGSVLFNLATTRRAIRYFLKDVYADPKAMTEETVELYWRSARHEGARYAAGAFVGMRLNCDIRRALPSLTCPVLLTWGQQAGQTPFRESKKVRAVAPNIPFVPLPGGDLPHEESPAAFLAATVPFLASAEAATR